MKAAVYTRYGPPEVIQIKDIGIPVPKDNEVLIKVRAASLNPLDSGLLKGGGRMVTGFRRPKVGRLGVDMAGQVEAVGRNVRQFKPGDEVFGLCISNPADSALRVWIAQGAFAEYACAHESALVIKPDKVTFEEAASAPVASLTALQGLRDKGQIQPRQKILVNGAAGGVGTFAVQIAKSFGAEVIGVCSTRNVNIVRSIGADRVVDYTQEDFTKGGQRYDLIFDCVGNHSLTAYRRILNPEGICVMVGDLSGHGIIAMLVRLVTALLLSRLGRRKLVTFLTRPNKADLIVVRDLMNAGTVKPIIDKHYTLSEIPEAVRYLEQRHTRGKVIMKFGI